MKIQKPSKGRVVFYVNNEKGHTLVAIIADVDNALLPAGRVSLHIFDGPFQRWQGDVPHCGAANKVGTWHYPPFVKEEVEVPE